MYLDVGNGHRIYLEEYGNPKGIDILFLHGGPGLGFSERDKAFFDSTKFHVIFIDQRGSGRSMPKGELTNNTTMDLISDVKLVLDHLKIESIIIFGGSWGATLAILVAAAFPNRINKLILRGFFSATQACTNIYLRGTIKATHPEDWQRVCSFVPSDRRNKVPEFYFESINGKKQKSEMLGYEWARYGLSLSRKTISKQELDQILSLVKVDLDRIKIELHYALNQFFIPEGYIFEQAVKIMAPVVIVHGRYDYLCPLEHAVHLDNVLNKSELKILDAGHSTAEKSIREALFEALEHL